MKAMIAVCAGLLMLSSVEVVEADGLSGPEAVRYDPELDLYFVSNFNDEPAGDANGFVSKMSPDGDVLVSTPNVTGSLCRTSRCIA